MGWALGTRLAVAWVISCNVSARRNLSNTEQLQRCSPIYSSPALHLQLSCKVLCSRTSLKTPLLAKHGECALRCCQFQHAHKGGYKPETKLLTIKVKLSVHVHTKSFNWTLVHYTCTGVKAIYTWTRAAAITIGSDGDSFSLLLLRHFRLSWNVRQPNSSQ